MYLNQELKWDYTKIPNDIHRICRNQNDYIFLITLIRLKGDKNSCFASLNTLGKFMLVKCKNTIENTIKWANSNGYIEYIKGNSYQKLANEYFVNLNKIISDINGKLGCDELSKKAIRELKISQRKAMAAKEMGKAENKDLLIRVAKAQGLNVVDSNEYNIDIDGNVIDKITGEIIGKLSDKDKVEVLYGG